jgi:ankyrin repeat protein
VDALIHAIRFRDLVRVKELLASGIDLTLAGAYGVTPLDEAIENDFPALAIEMIHRGAAVNFRSGYLSSPLAVAAGACLKHGADVNRQGADGDTALIIASGGCKDGKIVQILLNAGANPNHADSVGYTALINAADEGNERAAKKLIAAGANLNATNGAGETALVVARDRPFRRKARDRVYALLLKASRKGVALHR